MPSFQYKFYHYGTNVSIMFLAAFNYYFVTTIIQWLNYMENMYIVHIYRHTYEKWGDSECILAKRATVWEDSSTKVLGIAVRPLLSAELNHPQLMKPKFSTPNWSIVRLLLFAPLLSAVFETKI